MSTTGIKDFEKKAKITALLMKVLVHKHEYQFIKDEDHDEFLLVSNKTKTFTYQVKKEFRFLNVMTTDYTVSTAASSQPKWLQELMQSVREVK